MTASKPSMVQNWADPDDAPDLSAPEWQEKIEATTVRCGRPRAVAPKKSTTIRLDASILEHFQSMGPGWQTRLNQALRGLISVTQEK